MKRLSYLAASVALCLAAPAIAAPAIADSTVSRIVASQPFKTAAAALDSGHDQWVSEIIDITQIPAPPFKEEIRAGMTSINNSTTGAEAHLPFGGNGWSGNGTRESGIWVLDSYTRWQAVNVDLSGKLQKAQIDVTSTTRNDALDWGGLVR